jgi:hypothetical protein
MVRSLIACVFAGLVLVSVVSGCVSPPPFHEGSDLIPIRPLRLSGPDGFCDLSGDPESPKLGVSVQNIGESESPPSVTTIEFSPGGSHEIHTPAIPGGESIALMPVSIPLACFNPNCEFRITVDSRNEINGSRGEGNNEADGRCLGF